MEEESIRFPNLSLNRWIRARRVKNLGERARCVIRR
ncbi:unnamed protein product [Rhodiola kirilowii]